MCVCGEVWGCVVASDGVAVCVFMCGEGGERSKCRETRGSSWFRVMGEDGMGT